MLSPAEEEAIMQKGNSVPEGFWSHALHWQLLTNFCVAAAPNGDLYVSSDGCGSSDEMRIVEGFSD